MSRRCWRRDSFLAWSAPSLRTSADHAFYRRAACESASAENLLPELSSSRGCLAPRALGFTPVNPTIVNNDDSSSTVSPVAPCQVHRCFDHAAAGGWRGIRGGLGRVRRSKCGLL